MADLFQSYKLTKPNPSGPYKQEVVGAVNASAGAGDAGKFVVLNAQGRIDTSMGGGGGGGSSTFDAIGSGTNTTAHMTVGGTAVLDFTGGGVLNANEIGGISIAGNVPVHAGQILISQPGNTTALWADPFVQGPYAPGTNVNTGGIAGGPINPILIGGQGPTNLLANLLTDASGFLKVNIAAGSSGGVQYTGTPAVGVGTEVSTLASGYDGANVRPLLVSGTGQMHVIIDSGGSSGTQYADGFVVATPTGTVAMGFDGADVWALRLDGSKNLKVTQQGTVTVSGTVSISGSVSVTQGTTPWIVQEGTPAALSPASPAFSTVGVASAQAVATNASRKGLILTNTSSATISLAFGVAAVLFSGVTLAPYATFEMDNRSFYTGAVFAIASAAASNLSIQEWS